MANYVFFNPISDDDEQDLEFFQEWLEKQEEQNELDGTSYPIKEIRLTRKRNGYLITTARFILFLFKKDKIMVMLIEALSEYVNNGLGYELRVLVDLSAKNQYRIVADMDVETTWYELPGGKYSTTTPVGTMQSSNTLNPFLPATHSPLVPPTTTAVSTKRQRNPQRNQPSAS